MADGGKLLREGWQEVQSRNKPTVYSIDGALRRAADLAHPTNRDSALWAAQHALDSAIATNDTFRERAEFRSAVVIPKFNDHPDTTIEDALAVYDEAIKAQGRIKVVVSKAKGRK